MHGRDWYGLSIEKPDSAANPPMKSTQLTVIRNEACPTLASKKRFFVVISKVTLKMSVEILLASLNDSQSAKCPTSSIIYIEVVTLSLFFSSDLGALYYVQPAYESALKDIGQLYPCLRVRQNIIYQPNKNYLRCADLMPDSDHLLSSYFYHRTARWASANITTFVINTADCDVHAAGNLATMTDRLLISVGAPSDFHNKVKWSTRIAMGSNAAAIRAQVPFTISLLRYFNWTTVALVCDGPTKGPIPCTLAGVLKRGLDNVLNKPVDLVSFDGSAPAFNYVTALESLRHKTRVIIYSGMDERTLRQALITASRLNMTSGEFAHIVYISPTAPTYTWTKGDEDDKIIRMALDSVLFVEQDRARDAPPVGTVGYQMLQRWQRRSQELFNFTYSLDTPNLHLFAAYDMLMMLSEVVDGLAAANKTSTLGGGRNFYKQFLNRTFLTKTGNNYIDNTASIAGVCKFVQQYTVNGTYSVLYAMEGADFTVRKINPVAWPGNMWPVSSRPRCGFLGNDPVCLASGSESSLKLTVISTALSCLVMLIICPIGLKRIKAVDSSWWILSKDLLQVGVFGGSRSISYKAPSYGYLIL